MKNLSTFKLEELEPLYFKGYSLAKNLDGDDFVIPSGAVFSKALKKEKFKNVKFTEKIKTLSKNDILFNTGGVGTLGRSGFFDIESNHFTADPFVFVIRLNRKDISPKYVFFMLQTPQIEAQIQKRIVGTTGITSIKPKDILTMEISFPVNQSGRPDIVEQKRIVGLLEEIEELKKKRVDAEKKTKELIPALFFKMFGDPIPNSMRWDMEKLSDFCTITTGNTPSRANDEFYGYDLEWIKSDNILEDQPYPASAKEYLSKLGIAKARMVDKNSILMTCIAGSIKSIGNVALTDRKVAFNQQINALTLKDDTNPIFFYQLLRMSKAIIQKNTSQVLKFIVNKSTLEKVKVIRPSLALQNKFAKIVQEIENHREKQKQSGMSINELFSSTLFKVSDTPTLYHQVESGKNNTPSPLKIFPIQQAIGTTLQYGFERGEMPIAKVLYLAQEVYGVPLAISFTPQNFGPYDLSVKKALTAGLSRSNNFFRRNGSIYTLGSGASRLLRYSNSNVVRQMNKALDMLMPIIKSADSTSIERLATVCKVIQDNKTTAPNIIIEKVADWKPGKFTSEEIQRAITFILKQGWEQRLIR